MSVNFIVIATEKSVVGTASGISCEQKSAYSEEETGDRADRTGEPVTGPEDMRPVNIDNV